MKFLFINVVCGIGSTGRICTDIAESLEAKGHTVKIAHGRGPVPDKYKKYSVPVGGKLNTYIHALYARLDDASGLGSKIATKKFIKWIKEYDPDIIHLHNIHGYYLNVEMLFNYLRTCGKKIYWTLHDCWSFTGHSPYCDAANCEKWKTGCFKCPQLKYSPKSFVDKSKRNWNFRKKIFTGIPNMHLITPSNWLANLVKESFLKGYPVKVINNGINTKNFYPLRNDFKEKYHIENKFMILGVSSVFDEMKGIDDFIKLASIVDDDCVIVLVGKVEDKYLKLLPSNIIHIDHTNGIKEMAYIYNAADVFVNLTKQDTYPTVNLEAIGCGIPVVTYDVGGSTEIVNRYGGIVVPKGDIAGVQDALRKAECNKKSSFEEIDNTTSISNYVSIYLNCEIIGGGTSL